jgi:hypothetical protein
MTNENEKLDEVKKASGESVKDTDKSGPKPVGAFGIVLTVMFVSLVSLMLVCGLVQVWVPYSELREAGTPLNVNLWFWDFTISDEVGLLLIVAFAGGLGSQIRSMRSLSWYVGNRMLKRSWLLQYFLTPLVGAGLALIFYFVIRGGFFATETTAQQTSIYGFAGLAGLVGMFSEQAILKLKSVTETLFTKPKPGLDAKTQE